MALDVSPRAVSLVAGQRVPVSADGLLSDGSHTALSERVSWTVRDPSVAVLEKDRDGRWLRGLRAGGTMLLAAGEGLSAQLPIAVRGRAASGPLQVDEINPRYLRAANGELVYLTGSHTWTGVQDDGTVDPPPPFDYEAFMDFALERGHNLVRLWAWEQASWATDWEGGYWITPHPWARTGPGEALDGKPRFDLSTFDEAYFRRLRQRLEAARQRGLYVVVMLFNGWSVAPIGLGLENPWLGHPLHPENNVNGVNGDPDGSGDGGETHTLAIPEVTAVQEAYVRRVAEELRGFDHVLYEISNESRNESYAWQEHMIGVIRERERELGSPHPVGMTVQWPVGDNERLFESSADWVSPRRTHEKEPLEPMLARGRKVILYDTDHICGTCGEVPWVWKSLARGLQPLFMDSYDNHAVGLGAGTDTVPEETREAVRLNMGWARVYADRMDLRRALPAPDLATTPYVLAELDSRPARLLAYVEEHEVEIDLSAAPGPFSVEWFRPDTGETLYAAPLAGGARRALRAPVSPAVLFLEAR